MGILSLILMGFLVGVVAKSVMPGTNPQGFLLGGIGLPKDTSGTGEWGYPCEACGIGKEFAVRAE